MNTENKKTVREYWRSYSRDRNIMGWLVVNTDGDLETFYEPEGSNEIRLGSGSKLLHGFGDFYRKYGENMPRITLRDFISEYITQEVR
ncbi:MAG: hypothetical protein LBK68_07320 [Candidatus Margulisbacteria bacterium]|jgi:hypothetical protein|nr:hypothetical protein [Candidatus Margulisiibacteriota bacterium]